MPYRSLAASLERKRDRLHHAGAATALSAGLIPLMAPSAPQLLAPLAITAVICAFVTVWLRDTYVELLERLATDAAAYEIPAVRMFGERLVRSRERRRLAELIDVLIDHTDDAGSLGVPERVEAHRAEFQEIAHELVSARSANRPVVIARCRRLLIRAAESPLYNARIPADELTAALHRIRFGLAGL